MKKYHQSPTLGVRSGKRRRTPYVADRKFHESINNAEPVSRAPIATAKPTVWVVMKDVTFGAVFVFSVFAS